MTNARIEQLLQRFFQRLSRHPHGVALAVFGVSILIHVPFVIFNSFGEQDAARLAIKAIHSHQLLGQLRVGGQWALAYPAYIHMLYFFIHEGVLLPHDLPPMMATLSLVAGGLFSATFFLFFRIVLKNIGIPLVSVILLQFVPAFWISSLYGFPTIVALALFMLANWMWALGFQTTHITWRIGAALGALLLFQLSVCTKVDVILAAPLFCLPIWRSKWPIHSKYLGVGAVAVAVILTFYLLNLYGGMISADQTASESWSNWGKTFFTGAQGIFHPRHLWIVYRALGVCTLWGVGVSIALLLYRRCHQNVLFWTIAAGAPSALFWSLVAGNSARHNLILAALLPVILSLPLSVLSQRNRRAFLGGLVVMLLVNYYWFPASSSTVRPSGRLIGSARKVHSKVNRYHEKGMRLALEQESNVVIMGPPHLYPYYYFELLAAADQVMEFKLNKLIFKDKLGSIKTFVFINKSNKDQVKALSENGYVIIRMSVD